MKALSEATDLALDPLIASCGEFAWKSGLTARIRQLNHMIALMRAKAAEIIKKRTE